MMSLLLIFMGIYKAGDLDQLRIIPNVFPCGPGLVVRDTTAYK